MCRFNFRPGDDLLISNLCIDPTFTPEIIKYRQENFAYDEIFYTSTSTISEDKYYQDASFMPITETYYFLGRFFLINTPEDYQRLRLKIVKGLYSPQDDLNYNPALK